jgi:hypothetical protein
VNHLQRRHLTPKTITCYLQTVRIFFDYCINEEGMAMNNPVTKIAIRLPKPLPRHLTDDQVANFLGVIKKVRDRDYYKAMDVVLERMQALEEDESDPRSHARYHRGARSRHEGGAMPVLFIGEGSEQRTPGERGPT